MSPPLDTVSVRGDERRNVNTVFTVISILKNINEMKLTEAFCTMNLRPYEDTAATVPLTYFTIVVK